MRIMHEEGEGEKSNALSLFSARGGFFVAKTLVTDMRAGKDRDRGITGMLEESVFVELSRQFRPLFHATPFCTVVVHCTALTVLYAS